MKYLYAVTCFLMAVTVVTLLVRVNSTVSATQNSFDVLRAKRIEIVDARDRVSAVLNVDEKTSTPMLSFFDSEGHESLRMTVDRDGHSSLYFVNKHNDPVVSVGYLTASDVRVEAGEEDPLASWGVRVQAAGRTKSFDSFRLDPLNKIRLKRSIKPVRVAPSP